MEKLKNPPRSYGSQLIFPIPRMDSSLEGMLKEGFFLDIEEESVLSLDNSRREILRKNEIGTPSGRIFNVNYLRDLAQGGDVEAQDALFFYNNHIKGMNVLDSNDWSLLFDACQRGKYSMEG